MFFQNYTENLRYFNKAIEIGLPCMVVGNLKIMISIWNDIHFKLQRKDAAENPRGKYHRP